MKQMEDLNQKIAQLQQEIDGHKQTIFIKQSEIDGMHDRVH